MRIAVVGGGITGLAAAWEIRDEADVTIFEPGQPGGRLRTNAFDGHLVDEGPDAFLLRVPDALRLCDEVGIGSELLHPATGRALLWTGGRLRPLPAGVVLGVPRGLGGIAASGILSPVGIARAAIEPLLPRTAHPEKLTVRELVSSRFGAQVADRLVDPLLGGIHAGSTASLSAVEVAPQLVDAARRSRSLFLGLRKLPAPTAGPVFAAPRDGMGRLVQGLVDGLSQAGVTFERSEIKSVRRLAGGPLIVDDSHDPFDAVVLAVGAPVASRLLLSGALQKVAETAVASVAVITASFDGSVLPEGYSGFLVARTEGRFVTACTFASTKWPHWTSPGRSLVRISTGRAGDADPLSMDDDSLAERALDELGVALGASLSPRAARVSRWPDSFAQYGLGHSERVAQAEAALRREMPNVALAGSWYRGAGIPACIASGRAAARRVLAQRLSQS